MGCGQSGFVGIGALALPWMEIAGGLGPIVGKMGGRAGGWMGAVAGHRVVG